MPRDKRPKGQEAKPVTSDKAPAKRAASPAAADLDILREMVAMLENSSATEIKLARGDATYEVAKGGVPMMPAFAPAPHAPAGHAAAAPAAPAAEAPAPAAPKSNLIEIKSPMVGTFYRSPEPGAEPYAKPGTRVTTGQTLCIIEAMKIMNEIESEISGVVRDVMVEDAQPVEFGQVLFRVEPHV